MSPIENLENSLFVYLVKKKRNILLSKSENFPLPCDETLKTENT